MKAKVLFLTLALLCPMSLAAQKALRTAIESLAAQPQYITGIDAFSQIGKSATDPSYSVYTYDFNLPRKEGRKQVALFVRAYHEDAQSSLVTMKALYTTAVKGEKSSSERTYSVHYAPDRPPIIIGQRYAHLALIRTSSDLGDEHRTVVAVNWNEQGKRIVGCVHIIEGQKAATSASDNVLPSTTRQLFRDLWGGKETDGKDWSEMRRQFEEALKQMNAAGLDTVPWKDIRHYLDSIRGTLEGIPFSQTIPSTEGAMAQILDGGSRLITTHEATTVISPDGATVTIVGRDGESTVATYGSIHRQRTTRIRTPLSEQDKTAIQDYLQRMAFFNKTFTAYADERNKSIIRQTIALGTPLLEKMNHQQLLKVIHYISHWYVRLTKQEGEGEKKMERDLHKFLSRCVQQMTKTEHDSEEQ